MASRPLRQVLEKRLHNGIWQKRRCVLTDKKFALLREVTDARLLPPSIVFPMPASSHFKRSRSVCVERAR
jgi:hypothetical protein